MSEKQYDIVLRELLASGRVCVVDMQERYRITRLAPIIYDLRRRGYDIRTEPGSKPACYRLVQPAPALDKNGLFDEPEKVR